MYEANCRHSQTYSSSPQALCSRVVADTCAVQLYACLLQLGDEIMLHKHVSECCKFLTSSICVLGFSKNQRWGIRNRACGRLIKEQKVQSSRENSRGFVRAQTSTEKEIPKKTSLCICMHVSTLPSLEDSPAGVVVGSMTTSNVLMTCMHL